MLQRQRDLAAGLNTAGFISGYRGSPLGTSISRSCGPRRTSTRTTSSSSPASTRISRRPRSGASQQVNLFPRAKYDGVFGIWYGKGPGVDRSAMCSSTPTAPAPRERRRARVRRRRPCREVLDARRTRATTSSRRYDAGPEPGDVQEYLDFGVHGFAMSRYSGCWVAFKCVTDTVESAARSTSIRSG